MVKTTFSVTGLRELDKALGDLTKATARNVLRRALTKAAQPIKESAEAKLPSPGRTGVGNLRRSGIRITPKRPGGDVGKAAFADALRAGGSRADAVSEMRAARASDPAAFATIYIGPGRDPAAMMQEFGTVNHPPQPYMRPAFDAEAMTALKIIRTEIGTEIEKSAARAARKKARAG